MKIFTKKVPDTITYLSFFLISCAFLLIFSSHTSPLFNTYGGDSAIFILMGKMFLSGSIPYLDFFDHKGPVLIIIESLGLSLCSNERTGIFILQIINLLFIQILIYHISLCFLNRIQSIAIVLFSLLLFSFIIQGGNLTEEYSLPFTLLTLLFTIQFLFSPTHYLPAWRILLIGISFALLFWMRLNNIGVICACVSFIFIFFFLRKEWAIMRRFITYFAIGYIFVTFFVIAYFYYNNALYEMFYASFLFSFKYIHFEPEYSYLTLKSSLLHIVKAWTAFIVLFIGVSLYYKKKHDNNILLIGILLFVWGLLSTHIGVLYYHYMILNIPLFVLGLILIMSYINLNFNSSLIFLLIAFSSLSGYGVLKYNNDEYQKTQNDSLFIDDVNDIYTRIPEIERKSIYTYEVSASFWLITKTTPSYKYFIKQEWHGIHDKKIFTEINNMMKTQSPIWIIVSNQYKKSTPRNEEFYKLLHEEYVLHHKNENLLLYKKLAL